MPNHPSRPGKWGIERHHLLQARRRRAAGRRINPGTAMVWFNYAQVVDPYGDDPDLPPEACCVGREWFAADPAEQVPVHFSDLPDDVRASLERKRRLADRDGWAAIAELEGHSRPTERTEAMCPLSRTIDAGKDRRAPRQGRTKPSTYGDRKT